MADDVQLELALPTIRDADVAYADPVRRRPALTTSPAAMTNAELLALLVGARTAAILAATHGGIPDLRLLAATHPADHRDAGVTISALRRLETTFEIARRFGETEWLASEPFSGSGQVYLRYRERLAHERVEYFIAIALDNKHRKIRDVIVGQGSLTASIVHPRDVYARVLRMPPRRGSSSTITPVAIPLRRGRISTSPAGCARLVNSSGSRSSTTSLSAEAATSRSSTTGTGDPVATR